MSLEWRDPSSAVRRVALGSATKSASNTCSTKNLNAMS